MSKVFEIFSDKTKEFQCKVRVEGAALNKTKARMVLESDQHNLIYEGTIDGKGWCTIHITPTRELFVEGAVGKAKLEVIAEDTYFIPWESDFKVKSEKKVTVEVLQSEAPKLSDKPKVTVTQKINKMNEKKVTISDVSEKLYEHLITNGITSRAIRTRPKKITKLVEGFMRKYKFGSQSGKDIVTLALEKIQR